MVVHMTQDQMTASSLVAPPAGHAQEEEHAHICAEAVRALARGEKREALARYIEAYGLIPERYTVAVIIGDLLSDLGDAERAAHFYREVVRYHVSRRDYSKALMLLEKVALLCPDHVNTLETIGEINLRLARRTREIGVIEHHETVASEIFMQLAERQYKQGDHEAAANYYERALRVQKTDAHICSKLARELCFLGRKEEALNILLQTAELLLETRALDDADVLLGEALAVDGKNVNVQAFALRLSMARGQVAEGLRGLLRLQKVAPGNLTVMKTIARTYASFDKLGMARTWFSKAFKMDNDPKALSILAQRFVEQGNQDAALNTLLPVARAFAGQDRLEDAIRLILPTLQKKPHGPTLRVLYLLYRLSGDMRNAYKCLEEYLLLCDREKNHTGIDFLHMILSREQEGSQWHDHLRSMAHRYVTTYADHQESHWAKAKRDSQTPMPNPSWISMLVHAL